jgi:hypothetical protein
MAASQLPELFLAAILSELKNKYDKSEQTRDEHRYWGQVDSRLAA